MGTLGVLLPLSASCGHPSQDSPRSVESTRSVLHDVETLGKRDPGLASWLSLVRSPFHAAPDTTLRAWARSAEHPGYAEVQITPTDGALSASLWGKRDLTLRLVPRRSSGGPPRIVDGTAVSQDRHASTDVVVVVAAGRVEELLVLRDARAPARFEWTVERAEGLGAPVEDRGGIAFRGRHGEGQLRILPAFAIDAEGRRKRAPLHLDGDTLSVELDCTGMTYPVLLDPAVESGVWTPGPDGAPLGDNMAAAYDPIRQVVVVMSAHPTTAGTWEYDGASWTHVSADEPVRSAAAMAWFPKRNSVVMHGGLDTTGLLQDGLFEWNGASWTSLGTQSGRYLHSMAYDPLRGVMVIHSGYVNGGSSQPLDTTDEWDGTTWQTVSTAGPRAVAFGMAFEPNLGKVVVVGGRWLNPTNVSQAWDGSTWTPLPAFDRYDFPLVVDTLRGVTFADGGAYGTSLPAATDTLVLNTSAWTALPSQDDPGARAGHAAVYDEARGNTILFGGSLTGSYRLALHGGACSSGSECGSGNCVDAVCCDSPSCGTCEGCDVTGSEGTCAARKGESDDTCPAPKVCSANGDKSCEDVGESCVSPADCPGGFCVDGACCDAPCAGQCESCQGGQCLPTTGQPLPGKPACGDDSTCGALCDGTHRDACVFPTSELECDPSGPTECLSESEATGWGCDGVGACVITTKECAPFLCREGACLDSCSSDSDCVKGRRCEGSTCVAPPSECLSEGQAKLTDGTVQYCGWYKCVEGACPISCVSTDECRGGTECKAGRCRLSGPLPRAELSELTCQVRTPGRGGWWGLVGVVAGVAIALGGRRRNSGAVGAPQSRPPR